MNLRELTSPIRLYWDITPSAAEIDYRRICGEIISNKILSLQVTESAPALSPALRGILDELRNAPVAVSLTLPRAALDAPAFEHIRKSSVRVLFVGASAAVELGAVLEVRDLLGGKPAIGVSFSVTRGNFHELPEVLSFCADNKIPNLAFPMQRLVDEGEECFFLTRAERLELAERLGRIERPGGLKIIIHDPFLWRAFYPSVDFPSGGCQAANTMIYISPEADVYPCPSAPMPLGSLLREPLKSIIASDRKKKIRESLLEVPEQCRECADLSQCRGGCRGRVFRLNKSLEGPDPSCG